MNNGNGFVYSGQEVPGMGNSPYSNFNPSKWNEADFMSNFDGGDNGLNYRFFDQAENGYTGKDIVEEEAAFLDNLFACRRQCKGDLGGASSLRNCIRDCKGKGPRKSALKGKEADTNAQMAAALTALASDGGNASAARKSESGGSSKTIWIVVGIVVVIAIAVGIYFLTRNKAVPVSA
jgi:hypothetical protein